MPLGRIARPWWSVVLFGAAGNSDMDPYYPILSLILWSSLGLLCMIGGVLVINAVDHE